MRKHENTVKNDSFLARSASHFIIPSLLYMSQYTRFRRLVLFRTPRLLSVHTYKCWKQVGFMGYVTAFSHQDQTEEMQTSQGIIMKSWTLSCVSHKEQVWHLQLIQSCPACAAGPCSSPGTAAFPLFCPTCFEQTEAHILNNTPTSQRYCLVLQTRFY